MAEGARIQTLRWTLWDGFQTVPTTWNPLLNRGFMMPLSITRWLQGR